MIKRLLDLRKISRSFFLFGPRQTGKTSLIKEDLLPDLFINLLKQTEYLRYSQDPTLFSSEIEKMSEKKSTEKLLIVVDEIQRCPYLLNEIHTWMESKPGIRFVMTGSSARKLRQKGVNLLGGRAQTLHLFPLTHLELQSSFFLDDVLHFGSLPKVALESEEGNKIQFLKDYAETYLKEEIQQEALTKNIPAFGRFLELAAFENGHLLNFNNLSREVGVHSKTIREYYQILEDTLLGFYFYPYSRSHRERLVSHPRFYLFDTGIVFTLQQRLTSPLLKGTPPYGDAFEHWIILETKRVLSYRAREVKMSFFRTSDGAEVDLILEFGDRLWAIEIKSASDPRSSDLGGLKSFLSDHPVDRAICVCQTPRPYQRDKIEFLPWKTFFEEI